MLIFNPEKRYTVKQCLKHPYFEGLHNEEAEPECEEPFDWTWDDFEPTKEILQKMVYEESLEFHPDEEDEDQNWWFIIHWYADINVFITIYDGDYIS